VSHHLKFYKILHRFSIYLIYTSTKLYGRTRRMTCNSVIRIGLPL